MNKKLFQVNQKDTVAEDFTKNPKVSRSFEIEKEVCEMNIVDDGNNEFKVAEKFKEVEGIKENVEVKPSKRGRQGEGGGRPKVREGMVRLPFGLPSTALKDLKERADLLGGTIQELMTIKLQKIVSTTLANKEEILAKKEAFEIINPSDYTGFDWARNYDKIKIHESHGENVDTGIHVPKELKEQLNETRSLLGVTYKRLCEIAAYSIIFR